MKLTSIRFFSTFLKCVSATFAAVLACGALLPSAHAKGTVSVVNYFPGITIQEGTVPYTNTVNLQITSPFDYPAGVATTITLSAQVQNKPDGSDDATALSFISFSSNTLVFHNPNETLTVAVMTNIPAGFVAGSYGYQIYALGWPSALIPINMGAALNIAVTLPTTDTGTPPTVHISTPADASVYTYAFGTPAPSIPFSFTATATTAHPINQVAAQANGVNFPLGTIIGATLNGVLNDANVLASQTFQAPGPGVYTLSAAAANDVGTASDSVTITVQATGTPPTVTIAQPLTDATFVYTSGGSPVTVPFQYTGVSIYGVQSLTATLDGQPVTATTTGIGGLTATGSGTFQFTDAGQHTLVATVVDGFGTATATTVFTINVVNPPPAVTINQPADQAVFTLPTTGALSIPFTVTGTDAGTNITALNAMLNGNALSFTSTTGLGTARTATGSGTLSITAAGTYSLGATTSIADGQSANTAISFTVKQASIVPPTISIAQPVANSVYTYTTGGSVSVPVSFTGKSQYAVKTLSATLNGQPLTATISGLNSLTATGTATLSLNTAGTYTIVATTTDAYGSATASTTFTVKLQAGTICAAICQPTDKSVYTLPYCGSLCIPVSVSGTATGGNVTSLTTTLNGNPVTLCVTGLNTPNTKGTATLSIKNAGSYTLVTTAKNGALVSTKSVTFTVNLSNPCKISWQCPSTSTQCGGYTVCTKFYIQCPQTPTCQNWGGWCGDKSYSGGCSDDDDDDDNYCGTSGGWCGSSTWVVCDKSVVISVCEVYSNGTTSTPKLYTCSTSSYYCSSSNYSIQSGNCYQVNIPTAKGTHRYRVEVYGNGSGTTKPIILGTKEFCTK